ncbi:MAG: hypothetical protein JEZ09_07140 [Salinivirgaceae bacterium]|nr:hypothetical protein [Salinivirgaceae bacterium]
MKHIKNLFVVIIASAAITFFSSCIGNKKKTKDDTSVLMELEKDQVQKEVAEFVYPLPTAFEVTEMLQRIGASYIVTLSNAPDAVNKYFTEKSKAINLGIYNADLSYASTYNQKQNVIDYMKASNKLIEGLGFADVIDENTLKEIEAVENDKDKMVELITNSFYESYQYLNETNRGSLSVLVLAGTWVEGLYIATHISEDTYNNVEMVSLVMKQKEPLNKLIDLMKGYEANNDVIESLASLQKLHTIFNELEDGSISKDQMEAITKEVFTVRSEIVK